MEVVMIVLLAIAALSIFVVSFFKKDEHPEVDRKIENFSVTLMKELYEVNKKVDILQNEVFNSEAEKSFVNALSEDELQKKQMIKMYKDGFSSEEIAKVLALSKEDVEAHLVYLQEKSEVVSR
jgi:ATP/maltotriose-dependent transcriptional regulator MalT